MYLLFVPVFFSEIKMSEKCSNSDDLNLEDNISNEDFETAEKSAEKENCTEVPNGMLKFFPIYPYFGVPQVTHSTIVYLNILYYSEQIQRF